MENEAETKGFTHKHICVSICIWVKGLFSLNAWAASGRIGGLQEPMHLLLIGIWLFFAFELKVWSLVRSRVRKEYSWHCRLALRENS